MGFSSKCVLGLRKGSADMEAQQKEDVESKLQPGDQRWGKEDAKRGGKGPGEVRKGWWKVERRKVEPGR